MNDNVYAIADWKDWIKKKDFSAKKVWNSSEKHFKIKIRFFLSVEILGRKEKFSSENESWSSMLKFNNLTIAENKWNGYKIIWKPVKMWRTKNQIQKQKQK